MTNFITRMAGVATLALAALPMAAIATVSQAAPVTATVQVADLDLNTEAGMTAFHRRAEVAAQEFCSVNGANRSLAAQSACLKGVHPI